MALSSFVLAQPTPNDPFGPPNLPSDTNGDTPMGGSAPMDGGTLLLIGFALVYLTLKYQMEIRTFLLRKLKPVKG